MVTRTSPPNGAPCWADLWTSDVEASRRFYAELFGWTPQAPDPQHGGYFMWTLGEDPIAGGMGDMPEMPAQNVWKIYLATDDAAKTVDVAGSIGATVVVPPMPVADLGIQAVLVDPTGATLGIWQPGMFPGFTTLGEPGAPDWFELRARDYDAAVAFYQSAFGWKMTELAGEHSIRYSAARLSSEEGEVAGIMDTSTFVPAGGASTWSVYWRAEDVDEVAAKARSLGGAVVSEPADTPFGRIATITDLTGSELRLRAVAPRAQGV